MPGTSTHRHPKGFDIVFDEATHTYTTTFVAPAIPGHPTPQHVVKYTSGTTFIHKFTPPFDKDGKIAERKARERGVSPDQIRFEWKQKGVEATEMGTRVHETCEDILHGRQQFRNQPQSPHERNLMSSGWRACQFILKNYEIVGIEQMIGDIDLSIAGTMDLIAKRKSDGRWTIFDWKGLDVNTPIRTINGWKTMGTIQIGDVVFDKDGQETHVIHTSEVHHNPCYKITFDNGDSVVADHEHRWLVSFKNHEDIRDVVMTTEDISAHLLKIDGKRMSHNIPRIYNPKPITRSGSYSLPICPYVLGAWLGDGSKSCGIITNPNDRLFDYIHIRGGYDIGPDVSGGNGRCKMRTVYGLSKDLRKLGLIGSKHIPNDFIVSCDLFKKEILAGLMDTDGYYNPTRKQFSTSTTRQSQRDFVCELLASLGIKYSVFNVLKNCNGKKINAWDICFKCDFNPFKIRNQNIRFKSKHDHHSFRSIVSCVRVDTVPTRCIEVDSPTHTFLFGKQMIVTHNTNAKIDFENRWGGRMLHEIAHLHDCSAVHYGLQLNLYEYIMKHSGYLPRETPFDRAIIHLADDGPHPYPLPDYQIEVRDMVIHNLLEVPF